VIIYITMTADIIHTDTKLDMLCTQRWGLLVPNVT